MRKLAARVRDVVVNRVLNVDDTPHRIALGVFLGMVVAWTPTLGLQLVLYVTLATVFRANKLSGIPLVFVTNPVTAVPCYWLAWRVGAWVTGGPALDTPTALAAVTSEAAPPPDGPSWRALWDTLSAVGLDLWVGSLILGVATGALGYFLTRRGVALWRRRRAEA